MLGEGTEGLCLEGHCRAVLGGQIRTGLCWLGAWQGTVWGGGREAGRAVL